MNSLFKFSHRITTRSFLTGAIPLCVALGSQAQEAPLSCEYSRQSFDPLPSEFCLNIQTGFNNFGDIEFTSFQNAYCGAEDEPGEYEGLEILKEFVENLLNSLDYLRIETPKFVLRDENFRVKGNLFDPFANVRFYNSESGYVGHDKSNIEANAYKWMKISEVNGMAAVWITRGDITECSLETVYVQERPSVSIASTELGDGRIDVNVSRIVDQYSEAVVNPDTWGEIEVTVRSVLYGTVQRETYRFNDPQDITKVRVYPENGGGPYNVSVHIDDGNFTANSSQIQVFVPGTQKPPAGCGNSRTCR